MLEGIDVSHWQGPISWPKVKAAGKRFAIISSGDGAFLDPRFEENVEGAQAAGLAVDIYRYLRFNLTPEEQAVTCRNAFELGLQFGPIRRLWLDLEDTQTWAEQQTPEWRRDWLQELMQRCIGPAQVGIYTGAWWWNSRMASPSSFGEFPLWVADYVDPHSVRYAILPHGWSDWAIWQYTSSGQVDGIGGNVDLNVAKPGIFEEGDMLPVTGDEAEVRRLAREELKWDLLNFQARLAVAGELAKALGYALEDARLECKGQIRLARQAAEQWFPE